MNTAITFARKRIDVRYLVLATLAAACMGVSSTAVHAADDSEPMKTTVRYADLNLANPQGVEQPYQRIVSAARQVCSAADGRTLQEKAQFWAAPNSRLRAPLLRLTSRRWRRCIPSRRGNPRARRSLRSDSR